jgi:hypothetical protein
VSSIINSYYKSFTKNPRLRRKVARAQTREDWEKLGYYWFQGKEGHAKMLALAASGKLKHVRDITTIEIPRADLSFIGNCINIERLMILTGSSKPVDFSKLKKLRKAELAGVFSKVVYGHEELQLLEHLHLSSPTEDALARLGGMTSYLAVYGPPQVWPKLEAPEFVTRLRIVLSRKGPLDVTNISEMKNLKNIDMGRFSYGIVNGHELTKLEHLVELDLDFNETYDDKEWVFNFPALKDFSHWYKAGSDFTAEQYDRLLERGWVNQYQFDKARRRRDKGTG